MFNPLGGNQQEPVNSILIPGLCSYPWFLLFAGTTAVVCIWAVNWFQGLLWSHRTFLLHWAATFSILTCLRVPEISASGSINEPPLKPRGPPLNFIWDIYTFRLSSMRCIYLASGRANVWIQSVWFQNEQGFYDHHDVVLPSSTYLEVLTWCF